MGKITGALLTVLKVSRVAWYRSGGITAYYEQPSIDAPGLIAINGEKVIRLVIDREGHYADRPSPDVQQQLQQRGISLDSGWECLLDCHGAHINEAVKQSGCNAVKHYNGQIRVQCLSESTVTIFVDGQERWSSIDIDKSRRALEELDVVIWEGWYPDYQRDLF